MDDEDQMILDNIDEFVNDEMKIVTYKWLSLTLSLHVVKARRLLEEFLKKNENKLDVIYFVGGRRKDGDYTAFQYKLARKSSLDDVKTRFDEVTTCHIYSVQKSLLKNSDVLYANDVDIVKENLSQINKYSTIQCDLVRNLDETLSERIRNNPIVNGALHTPSISMNPLHKEDVKKPVITKDEKSRPQNNKETKTGKKTSAVSFFGKQIKDDNGKKSDLTTTSENKSIQATAVTDNKLVKPSDKEKVKTKVEKGGISGAFMKSKKNIKCVEDEGGDSKSDIKGEDEIMKKCDSTPSKNANEKKKSSPGNQSFKEERKTEKNSKKRKAVIDDSESDDDDFEKFLSKSKDPSSKSVETKLTKSKDKKAHLDTEMNLAEDIEVIAPTPEPITKKVKQRKRKRSESEFEKEVVDNDDLLTEDSPPGSEIVIDSSKSSTDKEVEIKSNGGGKRRGRRRVLKSKQFVNEDGYMVTRKEYESESFSEESDSEISEEKMKTLSPEKKEAIVKKKVVLDLEKKTKAHLSKPKQQASLMSFFKKK